MSDRTAQFRALYRDLRITDQLDWYSARSAEYARAHKQVIVVRNTLLLLAAAAGAGGQFASGTSRSALGVAAALLGALAGAVTAFEALIGFPQLEKLYRDAAFNMARAGIEWDAAADDSDLAGDLEKVEQIMRTENGQWGQLAIDAKDPAGAGG